MIRRTRTLALSLALTLAAAPAPAQDAPAAAHAEEARTVQVATVSLHVGGSEKQTKRVVYSPPPGWYVRSHHVECGKRYGQASFAVNTIPAGWRWKTDESTTESAKAKGSAGLAGQPGGQGSAEYERSSADKRSGSTSHHCLVVDVTAVGQGLWSGGSGVELTVTAELVRTGD